MPSKSSLLKEPTKSAKKQNILAELAIEEQKTVSNMDSFYRKKLFGKSAKKKVADKDKSDKKDKPDN